MILPKWFFHPLIFIIQSITFRFFSTLCMSITMVLWEKIISLFFGFFFVFMVAHWILLSLEEYLVISLKRVQIIINPWVFIATIYYLWKIANINIVKCRIQTSDLSVMIGGCPLYYQYGAFNNQPANVGWYNFTDRAYETTIHRRDTKNGLDKKTKRNLKQIG